MLVPAPCLCIHVSSVGSVVVSTEPEAVAGFVTASNVVTLVLSPGTTIVTNSSPASAVDIPLREGSPIVPKVSAFPVS